MHKQNQGDKTASAITSRCRRRGVANIGGSTGAATTADPEHDPVRALDRWVSQSVAPTALIGTRIVSDVANRFSCAAP